MNLSAEDRKSMVLEILKCFKLGLDLDSCRRSVDEARMNKINKNVVGINSNNNSGDKFRDGSSFIELIQNPVVVLIICVVILVIVLIISAFVCYRRKVRRANRINSENLSEYSAIVFPSVSSTPDPEPTDFQESLQIQDPPSYQVLFLSDQGLPSYNAIVDDCKTKITIETASTTAASTTAALTASTA